MRPPLITFVALNKLGSNITSLESLFKLDEDFELCLLDNGSVDQTYDYFNSIKDPRIKLIKKFDHNYGAIYAVNYALTFRSPGQDFCNFENDAIIKTEKPLQVFRDILYTYNYAQVHAGFPHYNEQERALFKQIGDYKIYDTTCWGMFYMLKGSIMDQLGYYCEASYGSDFDLNRRINDGLHQRTCLTLDVLIDHIYYSIFSCESCKTKQQVCSKLNKDCWVSVENNIWYSLNMEFHDKGYINHQIITDRISGNRPICCGTIHKDGSLPEDERQLSIRNGSFFNDAYTRYLNGDRNFPHRIVS